MIEVVDYDPTWPETFDELRRRYAGALVDVPVIAIEHVGSTSVPGLAAKPVIDVDIVVAAEHRSAAIAALVAIGFESRGDLGIPGRWAVRAPDGYPRTNTYVVVDTSLALRNHLGVRDTLRSDPELRDRYAAVKRELAGRFDDVDEYAVAKTPIVAEILAAAGLSGAERDDIAAVNQLPDS